MNVVATARRSATPLLFVSPAVPAPTGGGLRMRAWQFLLGLARDHRITLVAGSPAFPDEDRQPLEHLARWVEDVVILPWLARRDVELAARRLRESLRASPLPEAWTEPTRRLRARLDVVAARRFPRVHVFRLYMLPVALEILGRDGLERTELDLDDWESETIARIAALPSLSASRRRRLRKEASAYAALERMWLPKCARVVVCSDDDGGRVRDRYGLANVVTIENAIAVATDPPPRPRGASAFSFVGSLGYLPNEDAVRFFAGEILPRLRLERPEVKLIVAGVGASRALAKWLAAAPGVEWLGAVEEPDRCYARATAVVVPLRAGGGTRIKLLEAFARRRPVVSTSVGAESLSVTPGVHYLRADTPEEWLAACRRLLDAPELGDDLASWAHEWVQRHSLNAVTARVAALASDLSRADSF